MKRALLIAGMLALAACSTDTEPAPPPPASSPGAPAPAPPPETPADTCGAAQHQSLVGKPRSEIPVPVDPRKQRVLCTTCPMTMDHNPERLNFLFDAATGIIKEVRCG